MTPRILLLLGLLLPTSLPAADPPPAAVLPALGEDLDGTWAGSFDAAGMNLNVAFNIKTSGARSTVLVDIIDRTTPANGIPASSASRDGARVRFEVRDVGGTFEGALSGDRANLQGTWVQLNKRIPLTLKRRAK
jgi:hypothetical protein